MVAVGKSEDEMTVCGSGEMSWCRRGVIVRDSRGAEASVGPGGVEESEEGQRSWRPVAGRRVVESWETEVGRTRSEVGSGTGFILGVGHVDALARIPPRQRRA